MSSNVIFKLMWQVKIASLHNLKFFSLVKEIFKLVKLMSEKVNLKKNWHFQLQFRLLTCLVILL